MSARKSTYFLAVCFVSFMGAFFLPGCGGQKKDPKSEEGKPSPAGKAGILFVEPNHRYHIRLNISAEEKKAFAEILDEKAESPVGSDQEALTLIVKDTKPLVIKLPAAGKGKVTSRFEGVHERLAEAVDARKVEITATIEGKEYRFTKEDHKH